MNKDASSLEQFLVQEFKDPWVESKSLTITNGSNIGFNLTAIRSLKTFSATTLNFAIQAIIDQHNLMEFSIL
jgi:hypothetical protein